MWCLLASSSLLGKPRPNLERAVSFLPLLSVHVIPPHPIPCGLGPWRMFPVILSKTSVRSECKNLH